jgi:hypothetical protein
MSKSFKVVMKNDTIRFKVRISERLICNTNQPVPKFPTLEELKAFYNIGAL